MFGKNENYCQALSLTAWPLIRDTAFYSIALLLLVLFFVDDKIYWWEALVLFLWYGAYVLFMKFNVVAEAKFLTIFPSLKAKVRVFPWSLSSLHSRLLGEGVPMVTIFPSLKAIR